jgi:hypothetical protein
VLILITPATAHKARRFLLSLAEARPTVEVSSTYRDCDVLMLYGLGGPDRLPIATAHLAKGKPFIAWDLGYWDRGRTARKFRLSFNSNHPDTVMAGDSTGPDRFDLTMQHMGNVADPDGPIMIVGNGAKSNAVWSRDWAAKKSVELAERFPERKIIYRPKPGQPMEPGVKYHAVSAGPIDEELRGISLVVCRHSNVAVDACRMGVPVVCDAGAASAIYPKLLDDMHEQPDTGLRLNFLHRLAHWQWGDDEAAQAWQFIDRKLCDYI